MPKKIISISYKYPGQMLVDLWLDTNKVVNSNPDPAWIIELTFSALVPPGMTPTKYVAFIADMLTNIGNTELIARQNVDALQVHVGDTLA